MFSHCDLRRDVSGSAKVSGWYGLGREVTQNGEIQYAWSAVVAAYAIGNSRTGRRKMRFGNVSLRGG